LVYFCHKNITNSTIPVFLQFNTAMLKIQTLRNYVIIDAVKKLDKINGYTQNSEAVMEYGV
jgi:hypothetical protein